MKGDIGDVKHELALLIGSAAFLAVLAAVDVEKAVSAATPGPTKVYEGEKVSIDNLGYPVCEVVGHRTLYDPADEQVKTGTHQISLQWTQVGDDELTITAQLERLVRATRDLLWPATGPVSLPVIASAPIAIVSEEYSDLMPATIGGFVKGSVVMLTVQTVTV